MPIPNPRNMTRNMIVVSLVALLGCATARLDTEWKSPDLANRSLKASSVLVLCSAGDESLRRVCEDTWSRQLAERGVRSTRAYDIPGLPPGGKANPDEISAAAKRAGATSVMSTQLAPGYTSVAQPGPNIGVGIGGYGGSGGGITVGGVGISFPIGGTSITPSLAASTSLVDPVTNAIIWSGSATDTGTHEPPAKVAALTAVMIDAIGKSGLF